VNTTSQKILSILLFSPFVNKYQKGKNKREKALQPAEDHSSLLQSLLMSLSEGVAGFFPLETVLLSDSSSLSVTIARPA
jgi:hypothetical protein